MSFKLWLNTNNLYLSRRSKKPHTHLMMDGGTLCISHDLSNKFNEKYIEGIRSGEIIYLVEAKTTVFKLHFDIDFLNTDEIGFDMIQDIMIIMQDSLREIFYEDTSCIVCVTTPMRKSEELIKSGVHIIFSHLWVTSHIALCIRKFIITQLFSEIPGYEWESIIDKSVFKHSGFRVPWSNKASHCKLCNRNGKCSRVCNGYVNEKRPYLPRFGVNSECEFSDVPQEISMSMLMAVTIRGNNMAETPLRKTCTLDTDIHIDETTKCNFKKKDIETEIYDNRKIKIVEDFIREMIPHAYHSLSVTHIYKPAGTDGVFFIATDSRWCSNIKMKHTNNHIWFFMNEEGISQRCHSENGSCKCFKGTRKHISNNIKKEFFKKDTEEIKSLIEKTLQLYA